MRHVADMKFLAFENCRLKHVLQKTAPKTTADGSVLSLEAQLWKKLIVMMSKSGTLILFIC